MSPEDPKFVSIESGFLSLNNEQRQQALDQALKRYSVDLSHSLLKEFSNLHPNELVTAVDETFRKLSITLEAGPFQVTNLRGLLLYRGRQNAIIEVRKCNRWAERFASLDDVAETRAITDDPKAWEAIEHREKGEVLREHLAGFRGLQRQVGEIFCESFDFGRPGSLPSVGDVQQRLAARGHHATKDSIKSAVSQIRLKLKRKMKYDTRFA